MYVKICGSTYVQMHIQEQIAMNLEKNVGSNLLNIKYLGATPFSYHRFASKPNNRSLLSVITRFCKENEVCVKIRKTVCINRICDKISITNKSDLRKKKSIYLTSTKYIMSITKINSKCFGINSGNTDGLM